MGATWAGRILQQTPRELYKMRYLWQTSVRLDNSKLVALQGDEPRTPLLEAGGKTLAALKVS